jgi:NADPH:quinone reductase
MLAAVLTTPGGIPQCVEHPDPTPTEGRVIVRVAAAPIAPIDLLIASGQTYLGVPACPYVPGLQGIGVMPDGRRVFFATSAGMAPGDGSMAELCLVDPARTIDIPDSPDIDDAVAAPLGNSGVAAAGALRSGGLAHGQTVIVLGASGVVGKIGLQLAAAAGARVIAVARGEQALNRARELGAHDTVDASSGDVNSIAADLIAAAEGGAHLVLDPIAGVPAAAPGGRLVNLGESAGPVIAVPSALLRSRSLEVLGFTTLSLTWEQQREVLTELLGLVATGQLTVDVERVPLADAHLAWARMAESGRRARLVLVP